MMECRRRDLAILATAALAFFLYFNLRSLHKTSTARLSHFLHSPALPAWYSDGGAANSTLGFGTIVAVSKKSSHRRESLVTAANLTGIDVVIPDQPVWTDEDVESVKTKNKSIISRGSAMAWLGHLNALKWFVESNLSTALIIEDDVDWDIHLRHHQIPLVANGLRKLLNSTSSDPSDAYSALRHHNHPPTYWGDLTQWELLYLGHCGDYFDLKYWPELPHEIFNDDSLLPLERMHPDTEDWLREVGLSNRQRMVHKSKKPLCSFAYGVTRESAKRILRDLRTEEDGHGTWAYDVRLLEACRDLGWKCYTANPELFHHMDEHDSAITEINGKPLFPLKEKGDDNSTPNIACGARNEEFVRNKKNEVAIRELGHMARDPTMCLQGVLRKTDNVRGL